MGPMQDPVCGMTVQPEGGITAPYKDRTVPFCSTSCRSKFLEHPEKYTQLLVTPAMTNPRKTGR